MELKSQKRIAAQILKCSKKKVVFDVNSLNEIKEAITKADIRNLLKKRVIRFNTNKKEKSNIKSRIRKEQKKKNRQKGFGSRKGRKTARLGRKRRWINRIRVQRRLLKSLRNNNLVEKKKYQDLYMKAKGGFFRSRRHLMTYIEENKLLLKKEK